MPIPASGENLKLGKGSLLLATIVAGVEGAFDFVGNCEALEMSADVTKVQKYSSTQRSAPKIAEHVTRIGYTLTATLSEYTLDNLKKWYLGEASTKVQAIGAGVSITFEDDEVQSGKFLNLNARNVTNVIVTRDGSDVLTEDVDYVVFANAGLIQLRTAGAVVDGDTVEVTFDRPALTINQVRLAKQASSICHLIYQSDDANTDGVGSQDRLEIWRVSVAPEGTLNYIGDDYGTFQITLGVLDDSANHPTDPFGIHERIAA